MGINPITKDILEYGIMATISGVFLLQQNMLFRKVFEIQDKTLTALAKLESYLNNDSLKGKGLEMALNLKVEGLRWGLQKKVINYVVKNNIKENWGIIIREISVDIEERKQNFFLSLKDLADITILKAEMTSLNEELENTRNIIIELLQELKENGADDHTLYDLAQRSIETHFEHFENRMIQKHSELLN